MGKSSLKNWKLLTPFNKLVENPNESNCEHHMSKPCDSWDHMINPWAQNPLLSLHKSSHQHCKDGKRIANIVGSEGEFQFLSCVLELLGNERKEKRKDHSKHESMRMQEGKRSCSIKSKVLCIFSIESSKKQSKYGESKADFEHFFHDFWR